MQNKVYLPNLDGLRFIAASLVIVHHIEQIKLNYGFENYWSIPFFGIIGNLSAVLFFVTSGFLITNLLLIEETNFGDIGLKNFYFRRMRGIWPVYFLIIFLPFAVIAHFG